MPTTVKELWEQGWVADNEEDAIAQAHRMFDLFYGKQVEVDRLSFLHGEEPFLNFEEEFFVEPYPLVWVVGLDTDRGWDDDVLYAEWMVREADPDQIITDSDGRKWRMGDLAECDYDLRTAAPGIGTADGFDHRDIPLIYPAKERQP